jgi:hypothetical protein
MKQLLAFALAVVISANCFAADRPVGYNVTYSGGSLATVKSGQGLKLFIEGDRIRLASGKEDAVVIPASSITEVSYGQDVHRRVGTAVAVGAFTLGLGALVALSKSKKHFVGLIWANGDQKGGLAMQCSKDDYRGILAALEGVSGKTAINSEAMTVKN